MKMITVIQVEHNHTTFTTNKHMELHQRVIRYQKLVDKEIVPCSVEEVEQILATNQHVLFRDEVDGNRTISTAFLPMVIGFDNEEVDSFETAIICEDKVKVPMSYWTYEDAEE